MGSIMQQWNRRTGAGRIIFWAGCFLVSLTVSGCSSDENSDTLSSQNISKEDLPEHIQKLDSLTVYSAEDQPPDTVEFEQEAVFESNENVFFDGYTGEVAVDDSGRVYISVTKPGTVGVYVLNPDGSYLTRFLREGRGPGEFESIGSMILANNKIYIFGPRLQKVGIFSQDDYSLVDDFKIGRDVFENDSLSMYRADELVSVYNDGTMLMSFANHNLQYPNRERKIFYHKLSKDAEILPGKILQQNTIYRFKPKTRRNANGFIRLPLPMPFSRSALTAIYNSKIYSVWTEDFLIETYDTTGQYQRAFYYPVQKSVLSVKDEDFDESSETLIEDNSDRVPNTWPAVHNMAVDDVRRLWVLTITESDSTYKGWVLNPSGELLAKFSWPGHRLSRSVIAQPLFKVRNDYLYTRERDIRNGIDRIVKHRINLHPKMHQEEMN